MARSFIRSEVARSSCGLVFLALAPGVRRAASRRQSAAWITPGQSDTVDTLILDLLEWMGPNPRPYAEVLEAWRTSCPRLPVWEDANDRGFIARHHAPGRGVLVSVSAAGAEHLRKHRQPCRADGWPR
jgi:hypothetical protein